jgi:hypothetical protein
VTRQIPVRPCQTSTRIHQYPPEHAKIHQDQPEPTRTHQNPSEPASFHQSDSSNRESDPSKPSDPVRLVRPH